MIAVVVLALMAGTDRIVAIEGGDVYTGTGAVIRSGAVVIRNGVIEAVGRAVAVPEGAERYDATGRRVYPGFVAAHAVRVGIASGFDNKGRLADGLDPFDLSVDIALASGITSAHVEAGSLSFSVVSRADDAPNAVVRMTAGTLEDMVVREPASLDLTKWILATPSEHWDLRRKLNEARELGRRERAGEQGVRVSDEMRPYVEAVEGRLPVRIWASRAGAILQALRLVDEFPQVRLVLVGAEEGWTVADEIGRRGVACIVTPRSRLDPDREAMRPTGSRIENAAILHRAGVRLAIVPPMPAVSVGGIAGRDLMALPTEAAFAVRGGLPEDAALRAITLGAAEILGVSERIGSIEAGKDGDVIVLDGDPLDHRTFCLRAYVRGRKVYDKEEAPYFRDIRPAGR
jgi:imidazolonepropionase-like amidohydrolase